MDIKHHYVERGNGFPLILLHGNGEDGTYFEHQLEYFAKSYRVIAVDTRGHGQTPRGTAPFNIRQFSEDLPGFMDRLGIDRAHLLGFSDGGNIALVFALRHPERVEKLILNGANLNPRGVKSAVQLPIEFGWRIARLCSRFSDGARANAEVLGLMVNDPNIPESALSGLRMPVLVIVGTHDMIRRDHSMRIASLIPGALFREIEGDHFIAAKRPDTFNDVVATFLEM